MCASILKIWPGLPRTPWVASCSWVLLKSLKLIPFTSGVPFHSTNKSSTYSDIASIDDSVSTIRSHWDDGKDLTKLTKNFLLFARDKLLRIYRGCYLDALWAGIGFMRRPQRASIDDMAQGHGP